MLMIYITSNNLNECALNLNDATLIQQWDLILKVLDLLSKYNYIWPVIKMWVKYDDALKIYHNYIIRECCNRGIQNDNMFLFDINENHYIIKNTFDGTKTFFHSPTKKELDNKVLFPKWFSFHPLILSHKAALLRENPYYYKMFLHECRKYLKYGLIDIKSKEIYTNFNSINFFDLNTCIPNYYPFSQRILKNNINRNYNNLHKYDEASDFIIFLNNTPDDDVSKIVYKLIY